MAEDARREREDQSEALRALARSEARFRAAVQAVDGILWTNNARGEMEGEQPGWAALTGQGYVEYQGFGWSAAVHPADAGPTIDAWNQAVAERRTFEFEHRVRRKDGVWRLFAIRAVPLLTETGEVLEWVGVHSDVTEARAAEADADALYRAHFENAAEVIFIIGQLSDGRFTVEATNPACRAETGVDAATQQGLPLEEQMTGPLDGLTRRYHQVFETGEVQRYREARDFGGGPRHWETVLAPIRRADGRVARLVGTARDVTAQVLAEDALRHSQKMEAVGQLTGGIAHDFNNVLGALIGSLDLIRRGARDEARVRRLADAGLHAAERGAKLTSQLLAFSRAQRLELQPLDVGALVEGMRELLAHSLGPQIDMVVEMPEPPLRVLSEPTQLEMAILNMAINARDAMPGGGRITIAVRRARIADDPELDDGERAELSVSDTGTGMAPEVAARAFEPFFTTKEIGKGTGLGLSQVYGIARNSGGVARLESRPGQGTTVRLILPITDRPPAGPPGAETTLEAAREGAATILVVDDDGDMRGVLVEAVKSLGYAVTEASDGAACLDQLESTSPDLLLLDFAMPGMNGAEVAASARRKRPDLPIVFASGYSDSGAIENALGPEAVVLRKPFRVAELQAVLAEALAGRQRRAP